MRRGRSRVGVERLEPTSSRIILHLRRLSVAVLAAGGGWVDSVPFATRQSPVRSHRLRSVGSAMRRSGAAGRCRAIQWRTRVASASTTRATPSPRSRPRTLRGGAQQCQLDRTACARYGTQRVGRTVRGGAGRLCWAIACGGGPPPRARTSCPGCACAWSCGATHGTVARACWCRRATGATLHRP